MKSGTSHPGFILKSVIQSPFSSCLPGLTKQFPNDFHFEFSQKVLGFKAKIVGGGRTTKLGIIFLSSSIPK